MPSDGNTSHGPAKKDLKVQHTENVWTNLSNLPIIGGAQGYYGFHSFLVVD
jgi:hypothetical protein